MSSAAEDPLHLVEDDETRIAAWGAELERGRWPGWIIDPQLRLRFASSELKAFMSDSLGSEVDDTAAGVGRGIFEALTNDVWTATMTPESLATLMPRVMGYLKDEFGEERASQLVPEGFRPFLEVAQDIDNHGMFSDHFDYAVPGLPSLKVEFLLSAIRGRDGRLQGVLCVSQMGVRPTLVSLLSRGDERMFERMANLQDPRRCQGAVLFADLEGSTRLSRLLPTSAYFSMIRSLATHADAAIADNDGVVGRHAGDGVSAFFLVSEGTDASSIAASAIITARRIQVAANEAIAEAVRDMGVDPSGYRMNVGVHWGASIFMGQLVPGGRLDVTALGDSVNECARIEEAARGGALLASKQLVEQLTPVDAKNVGVDPERLVYRPISELEDVSEKAVRDAGLIAVTRLD